MLKPYDFMILWEECVLLKDAKVSRPNSTFFLAKSCWQVLFEASANSWEYGHWSYPKKWKYSFSGCWSTISTYFSLTNSGITERGNLVRKIITKLTFLITFYSWVLFHLNLFHLIRKPGARSLAGRRMCWVLKLWYLEEAQILPTIPNIQKVWAFFEKIAAQKALQPLISTPP